MADTIQSKQVELTSIDGAGEQTANLRAARIESMIGTSSEAVGSRGLKLSTLVDTSSVDDGAVGTGQAEVVSIAGAGGDARLFTAAQAEIVSIIDTGPGDILSFQPDGAILRNMSLRNAGIHGGTRGAVPINPFDPRDQRKAIGQLPPPPPSFPYKPPALPQRFDAYRIVIRRTYDAGEDIQDGTHQKWDASTRVNCSIRSVTFVPKGMALPVSNGQAGGVTRFPSRTEAEQFDDAPFSYLFTDPARMLRPPTTIDEADKLYSFATTDGFPKYVDCAFPVADQPIDRVEVTIPRVYGKGAPEQFDVERYDPVDRLWRTIARSGASIRYKTNTAQGNAYSYTLPINPDPNFLNTAHRFWRVVWKGANVNAYQQHLHKLQFRQQIGVEEFSSGGVPFASPIDSGVLADVFKVTPDAALAFGPTQQDAEGNSPYWVGYQYAQPVRIVEVAMRVAANRLSTYSTANLFEVQASDDGVTWWTIYNVPQRQRGWTFTDRVFTFPPTASAGPV